MHLLGTKTVIKRVLLLLSLTGVMAGFTLIPEKNPVRIVAFGDSITAARKGISQVFVQRLPGLLEGKMAVEIINAGVGSSHSGTIHDNSVAKVSHGRDRFEEAVLAQKPDLVIIAFGANDAYIDSNTPDGASRISLEQYRDNLVYMITALRKQKAKVILVAPSPGAAPRPDFQNERLYQYAKEIRALAKKYRTGLADNYQLFEDYGEKNGGYESLLPDGIHPNDEGHRLIAENLAKQIQRLYKK